MDGTGRYNPVSFPDDLLIIGLAFLTILFAWAIYYAASWRRGRIRKRKGNQP